MTLHEEMQERLSVLSHWRSLAKHSVFPLRSPSQTTPIHSLFEICRTRNMQRWQTAILQVGWLWLGFAP